LSKVAYGSTKPANVIKNLSNLIISMSLFFNQSITAHNNRKTTTWKYQGWTEENESPWYSISAILQHSWVGCTNCA